MTKSQCKILTILILMFFIQVRVYAKEPLPDAEIAWQEKIENRYIVQYSKLKNKNWTQPSTIYNGSLDCLHPSITSNNQGTTWIAWTLSDGKSSNIATCEIRDGMCAHVEMLHTQMPSNIAPSIIMDKSGCLWVVWTGFDGKDDEIFCSRKEEGGTWSTPLQVNGDDHYPDILPYIILNDQYRPTVYWHGYNGEKYVEYFAVWEGNAWSTEKTSDHLNAYREMLVQKKVDIPNLPAFVEENAKGSMHIKSERHFQSISINQN